MPVACGGRQFVERGKTQETAKFVLHSRQEEMLKTIFNAAQLKQIGKWIAGQADPAIDRPEAIRRLVELGMKAKKS